MNIHYAVQVCDIANNQVADRYSGTDRTTVSIKCLSSLMESIDYVATKDDTAYIVHNVTFFDDNSSPRLKSFLNDLKIHFAKNNIRLNVVELQEHGIMNSIGACYEYLRTNGTDLVYQIQDDYLYAKTCIYEMLEIYHKVLSETKEQCVVYPHNSTLPWRTTYRNRPTPRVVFYGANRVWIQIYDTSCCFMTSVNRLRENKDLTDLFLSLPPKGLDGDLESISLNYMFTKKGILGVTPVESLALHIQGEENKDPYIDWKVWWNSIQNYESEKKMSSLIDLYNTVEKPSVKWDSYFDAFDLHLSKYVGMQPRVLEIGIADGGSLEFWGKFFKNAEVYGIDAAEKVLSFKYDDPKIHVSLGDQSDPEFWDWYLKDKKKFDVIVDDGSHINDHQILTLIKLFPHLEEGGTYIIEDTHTSYWAQWGGGFRKENTCIEFTKSLIDFLHRQHIDQSAPEKLVQVFNNLKSMTFYNSMVVLVKDHVKDMKPVSNKQQ